MATFTYHLSRGWEIKPTEEREWEQSKSKSHLVLWCGTRRRTHSRVRARWKTKSRKKKSFDGWRCSVCRLTLGSAVAFSGMTSVSTKRSALVTSKLASSVFYSTALLIPSTMILNSSSLASARDSTRNSPFYFLLLFFLICLLLKFQFELFFHILAEWIWNSQRLKFGFRIWWWNHSSTWEVERYQQFPISSLTWQK